MGKFTCYDPNADNPSVIDYALADRELFNEISYFRVKDFTTFSDHCPIELKINADYTIKKHFNQTLKLSAGVEIRCIVIAQHKCFSSNASDVS